jgi:hypothetical protein
VLRGPTYPWLDASREAAWRPYLSVSTTQPALVRIETSGNQAYLFASNRLRQNVGASELVLRSCSQWVLEAVARITHRQLWADSVGERTERLRSRSLNPRLGEGGNQVEVVTATSGAASLLTADPSLGRQVVEEVTRRALREAPGLAVAGAVVEVDLSGEDRSGFQVAFQGAGAELRRVRSRLPAPEVRFRQLPIVDHCRTTGLPAASYDVPFGQEPPEQRSVVARAKLAASDLTQSRLRQEPWINDRGRLARSLAELEPRLEEAEERWLAVIHADGNGLGALLGHLGERWRKGDRVEGFRWVSTGLERLAVWAFDCALKAAVKVREHARKEDIHGHDLVVPLVMGGDDLTVVCDGALAMPFATAYLQAFEAKSTEELGEFLQAVKAPRLTASAGVALVKPHYPFHAAYDLAEELTQSAKLVKRHAPWCSALDVHLHLDTADADLERIRRRRRSRDPESIALWGGPYLLGPTEGRWATMHALRRLGQVVQALCQREDGRPVVSSRLVHRLRAALAEGPERANAELERARRAQLNPQLWSALLAAGDGCSLVHQEPGLHPSAGKAEPVPAYATALLDAIDLAGLWDGKVGEERP